MSWFWPNYIYVCAYIYSSTFSIEAWNNSDELTVAMKNSSQKTKPKYHSKLEFISKHQKEFYIFKSSTLKSISHFLPNSDQTVIVVTIVMWMPQIVQYQLYVPESSPTLLWVVLQWRCTLQCSYYKLGWHCQRAKEGIMVGVTARWMLA